jgi:putative ABC transport system permease protein
MAPDANLDRPGRLYRLLLRLYPAEFRDEYGREMSQMVRDRIAREPRIRLWLDLALDLARTAPTEHAHVLLNDLRYAARLIRRAPMFTSAVVATVALAIAANTAIFSVVNAVLLRPLPFAEPDRLVQVAEKNDKLNVPNFGASVLNFLSWRERTRAFERLGAIGFASFTLSGGGEPEQLTGNRLSPSLMPILGIAPVAGRGFTDAEERPGAPAVAMIGEGLWARRFGRDPSIVGRTVMLDRAPVTIVGVAPAAVSLVSGGDVYVPLTIDPSKEIRLNHVIFVAGRLKPRVTMQQAQAEFDAIAEAMGRTYPEMRDWGVHLVSFFDTFVSAQLKTGLLVLLGAVAFVLLIACANIANLLLSRSAARQREIAVRMAMGATRNRVLRQLLVESVALSAIGGAAGIVAAMWVVGAIDGSLPPNLLPVRGVHVDARVLTFAAGLTLFTGLVFGIAPASYTAKADVHDMLRNTARGSGNGGRARLRSGLAAAELALATLLLVGAGLLVESFLNLQRAHLGFDSRGLLTFQLAPPTSKYPLTDKAPAFYRALLESLRATPGVRSAAVSSGIPFGQGAYTTSPLQAVGPSALPPDTAVPIDWRIVSPGYFAAMNIPLLRGRDFSDADAATPAIAIASQATARKFWGDMNPIGRTLRRSADTRVITIVGVVGDVRSTALNQESPALYYPISFRAWPLMDVVVRAGVPPESLLPSLRQKVRDLDGELPLATVRTMDEWLASSAAQPRLSAALLGAFAAVAVLIAAIGIYGVLAYSVNLRTREIGLRMALGARPGGVMRLIVKEGMTVAIAGIAAGLLGAAVLGRAIASLVYGVQIDDPATYAGVGLALNLVAIAACWIPARRAARLDPMDALRCE